MEALSRLDPRIDWSPELIEIDQLDRQSSTADFDRLCRFVAELILSRLSISQAQLFEIMSEDDFRSHVRASAERFEDRFACLPMFIYLRFRFLILPRYRRQMER